MFDLDQTIHGVPHECSKFLP